MKIVFIVCCISMAAPVFADGLIVSDAWARATPSGAINGAVYLTLSNTSTVSIRIEEVETAIAGISEMHESTEKNGMMKMRLIRALVIGAGESVKFQPGQKHIMLMQMQQPLKAGSKFQLVVTDDHQHRTKVEVLVGSYGQNKMPVRP